MHHSSIYNLETSSVPYMIVILEEERELKGSL